MTEKFAESDAGRADGAVVYVVGGVVGGVSVLILAVLVSRQCRRRRRPAAITNSFGTLEADGKTSRNTNFSGGVDPLPTSNCDEVDLEMAPSAVQIVRRVGNSRFGTVYIGNVVSSKAAASAAPVVVKTLAGDVDQVTREFFIGRTHAMVGLRHANVLRLVGACLQQTSQTAIISALFEHHSGVDLGAFLDGATGTCCARRTAVLLRLAGDSACGLAYLARHAFVHADVAAGSILVLLDADGRPLTAKICDVGLASPWCTCCGRHRCFRPTRTTVGRVDSSAPCTPPELMLSPIGNTMCYSNSN